MDYDIVILDGFTATQHDLSWQEMQELGRVTIYSRTRTDDIAERCRNADAVLTNKVVVSADVMAQLPRLKYIGVLATGYNVVDLETARRRGIVVTNIPAYSTQSVAQMVFAHILNVTNRVDHYARLNRQGRWTHSEDFCWMDTPVAELEGKTLGVVGLGNIGSAVARIAHSFGMKVLACTSKPCESLPAYVAKADMESVFGHSDFLSLHCPLTDGTRGMVCRATIGQMKPGAVVINTGRGGLVNEQDVADALQSGRLGAFCADVLSTEPPLADCPLLACEHAYITPHIAWASREARQRLIRMAAENLAAFMAGKPMNVVS